MFAITVRISKKLTSRRLWLTVGYTAFLGVAVIVMPNRCPAQAVSPAQSEFEVASIRQVPAGHTVEELQRGIGLFSISPYGTNRLTIRNANLAVLIEIAYGVDGDQLLGKPDWLESDAFDISAKAAGD